MNQVIKIYTDGACSGNPGKGGWGAVLLISGNKPRELHGVESNTTNNQMELAAVINGLQDITESQDIIIYTDSIYVKKGITEWIFNWKKNGWKTASKQPVKNKILWQTLDTQVQRHKSIEWVWVKGHDGNYYNELADELARKGVY